MRFVKTSLLSIKVVLIVIFVSVSTILILTTFNFNNIILSKNNNAVLANSNLLYINNENEFANFINDVNNGNSYENFTVYLNNDLDLSKLSPLDYACSETFAGEFNGQGYTIDNYVLSVGSSNYCGMFGTLTGLVTNLELNATFNLSKDISGSKYIGAIAGYLRSENGGAKNCAITLNITQDDDFTYENLKLILNIGIAFGRIDDEVLEENIADLSIGGDWSVFNEWLPNYSGFINLALLASRTNSNFEFATIYTSVTGVNSEYFNQNDIFIDETLSNSTAETFDAEAFSNWYFDTQEDKPKLKIFKEDEIPNTPTVVITPKLIKDTFIYSSAAPVLEFEDLGYSGVEIVADTQNCINVGTYSVPLELKGENADDYILEENSVDIEIKPYTVDVLWGDTQLVYTGETQVPEYTFTLPDFANDKIFTISGGGVNVGKFTAEITTSSKNFIINNAKCDFEIVPLNVYVQIDNKTTTYGETLPELTYTILYNYNNLENNIISLDLNNASNLDNTTINLESNISNLSFDLVLENVASMEKLNTGKYKILIENENKNFNIVYNEAFLQITPREINLKIENLTAEFDSNEKVVEFVAENILPSDILITVELKTTNIKNSGTYPLEFVIIGDVFGNYVLRNELFTFTVTPKKITAEWGRSEFVYNGKVQIPSINVLGLSAENLQISGGAKDVGSYFATAKSLDKNYIIENDTCSFEITPYNLETVWTNTTVYFNNETQTPTYTITNLPDFEEIELEISGGASSVGQYSARLSINNKNFSISNSECPYSIKPYEVTITWTKLDLIFSGTVQAPEFSADLPEFANDLEIKLLGTGSNAGAYNAYLVCENNNFKLLNETFTYTIQPLSLSVEWEISEFIYNGEYQVPEFSVNLPEFISNLDCKVIGAGMNAGKYSAYVSVDTLDLNYKNIILTNNVCEYYIQPLPVVLEWGGTSFEYDGNLHIPQIISCNVDLGELGLGDWDLGEINLYELDLTELNLTIQGEQNEVGEYTALAVCQNSNFELVNASCNFEILPRVINVECDEINFSISTSNTVLSSADIEVSEIKDFNKNLPQNYVYFLGFDINEDIIDPSCEYSVSITLPENLVLPSNLSLLGEDLLELNWQINDNVITFSCSNLGSIYFVYLSENSVPVSIIICGSVVLVALFVAIFVIYQKIKNKKIYFKQIDD